LKQKSLKIEIKKMTYKIVSKYIKNLKFEIGNPDIFFSLTNNISNYKFKIDIKSKQFKNNIIEIDTTLELVPINQDFETINAKATFASLIELDKNLKDKKSLEEIILIKVPTEIYPELRRTFIFVFECSGFREIKIDERVDFKKLYNSRNN